MLKWLLKSLIILAIFVPFAAGLPLAAVALSRTPDGAAFLFFAGPWSCCFWVLIYSQWSSARVWQRAGKLKDWRRDHGGITRTVPRACGWMLLGLFGSYAAEFLLLWIARSPTWLPLATYSPLIPAWLWRRVYA